MNEYINSPKPNSCPFITCLTGRSPRNSHRALRLASSGSASRQFRVQNDAVSAEMLNWLGSNITA